MSQSEWAIHWTHPSGTTTHYFTGTREEAEAIGALRIGKVASYNATRNPATPNTWDLYTSWRVEPRED